HDLTDWQSIVCLLLAALPFGLVLLGQSPLIIGLGTKLARRLGLIKIGTGDQASGLGFDLAVGHLYRRHRTVVVAVLWHLVAWACRTGETWMVLRLLGASVDWVG